MRLGTVTAAVAALGLAVELVHAFSHHPGVEAAVEFLSLSYEQNLPTWYASALLLGCAARLAAIARDVSAWRAHFWGLAVAFAYLSLDETAEIHEQLGGLVGTGGLLYFDWVVPAAAAVAIFGAVYWPFLCALPAATRRRFVTAGALYVGGALLMELPLGLWVEHAGDDNTTYAMIDFVEETLELAGATLFFHSLGDALGPRAARREKRGP